MPLAHRRNLARTIARRRISFRLCCRWRSVKNPTSKSTEPTTTRRMERVFATTSTSSISRARTFWRLGERASGCYNLGTGGGSSVREVIESPAKSLDEKSTRSKNHADSATRPGSSPPRRESKRNLAGNRNSNPSTRLSRALGNGIRNFHAATKIKAGQRCCRVRCPQRKSRPGEYDYALRTAHTTAHAAGE